MKVCPARRQRRIPPRLKDGGLPAPVFVNLPGAVVQVITYGTGLTLFGYLIALAGVTWLVLLRPHQARVKRRLPDL